MAYRAAVIGGSGYTGAELLRLLGFGQESLRRDEGLAFAVRRCLVDYRGAARLDDELAIESRLVALGGASLEVEQLVRRG